MSTLTPFSPRELESIRELIERNGWKIEGYRDNYFRYSIKKNKTIIFTIKIPVNLPIRLKIPFEVCGFKVSFFFQFWNLNNEIIEILKYLMTNLRNLALNASIEHDFQVQDREGRLINILNMVIPEPIVGENERAWLNRIRISLMSKRDQYEQYDAKLIDDLLEVLQLSNLEPSFKIPWELAQGLPKIRTPETLFFSNEESEFFILEKGYFTYFKDIEFNKIHMRTYFESYSPYILTNLFEDSPNFKLTSLVKEWIRFSRMLLNSIIDIVNGAEINTNDIIKINPEKELESEDFELGHNNFPFTALSYEGKIAKELFPAHCELLNKPPTNFKVLGQFNTYTEAEEMIRNYNFEEATNVLNDSLKIFNKFQQKKAVVSVLLLLSKIAKLLNKRKIALNYLESALGVAKSGGVPINLIIRLHYKLGKFYYSFEEFNKAFSHFNIIVNFLEKEDIAIYKDYHLGMAYLFIGLIYLEREEKIAESKKYFKKTFQIGRNELRVKLKLYLFRSKYFKNKGNLSLAQKFLKIGLNSASNVFINAKSKNILIDLQLELADFYIYHRTKPTAKKALQLLKNAENYISIKNIPGLRRAVRCNLLYSDYYKFIAKDAKNADYYLKQAQTMKYQLNKIGVGV